MARGDFVLFEEFAENIGGGDHTLDSDTLKLGIVDDVVTPTAADATPTWSDYSANEVSALGNYVADGITLTLVTYTEAAGVATLDAADITIDQHASGFTDGHWAILYNSTNVAGVAIGFIDLGGPVSEVAGPVEVNWNASGIFTLTIS